MDRTAIVINTCPKYMYLLEAHFGLLRRYGEQCKWPVYLATELWKDDKLKSICNRYSINILPIEESDSDFFESRIAAMKGLPESIQYVLPLQDDFLLERPGVNIEELEKIISLFDNNSAIASVRLMPCPGASSNVKVWGKLQKLGPEDLLFSYQATIWRKEIYTSYLERLVTHCKEIFPETTKTRSTWNTFAITVNPAETMTGITLLKMMYPNVQHLCWPRKGTWANAVYDCPWPYRPTAVVHGVLQPWAIELIRREGFIAKPETS